MIGVSWMPMRARAAKRKASNYNPRRIPPRVGRTHSDRPYSLRLAIFGRGASVPAARLRGPSGELTAAALRGWLAAARQWLHPRMVPLVFAGVGLVAILGSTAWLRRLATETPAHLVTPAPPEQPRTYIDQDGHHRYYKVVQR